MARRHECSADPLDLTRLQTALEDACSARDKKVRAKAREWLVQFYRLLEVHLADEPRAGSGEFEERQVEAVRICLELYRLRSRQLDEGGGEIQTDIEREAGQANVEVRLRNFVEAVRVDLDRGRRSMSALDTLGHLGGKPLIVGGNAATEKFFDGRLRALALEAYAKTHPTQELCAKHAKARWTRPGSA
jgi:hypothetical protein